MSVGRSSIRQEGHGNSGQSPNRGHWLVVGCLVLLTLQSVGFSLAFRLARRSGSTFSNVSMLVVSEIVKLVCSLAAIASQGGFSSLAESLLRMFWHDARTTRWMSVPGLLFLLQNWLFFTAISNLSVCFYMVSKQLVILTTAIAWVMFTGKRICGVQWVALFVLLAGVCSTTAQGDFVSRGNMALGIASSVGACFLSSAASIYIEIMLQKERMTLWENNLLLSFFGVVFGFGAILLEGPDEVFVRGLTHSFNSMVWVVVFLQAWMGLMTAVVLKYSNSVTKCVSKAAAVVLGSISSRFFIDEGPRMDSPLILAGILCTIVSILLYSFGIEWLMAVLRADVKANVAKVDHSAGQRGSGKVDAELIGLTSSVGEDMSEPEELQRRSSDDDAL